MRVLGRTRLSRSTEESTSIERQREIIESWAKQNDHEIVGWAEDVDVSGSVDPFEAPELGPWLSEERMGEWDILCSWKMDRLARRTVPLHRLIGWTMDNDKTMVCVSDNIDLSTWVGRLVASVIAGVAEGELEAIRERLVSSHRKLRSVGRWHGGRIPYGYNPLEMESGGWTFTVDEEAEKWIKRMVELIFEGVSAYKIAQELNDAGVLSPTDRVNRIMGRDLKHNKWTGPAVTRTLRSKSLLGWTTHQGATVRDDQGRPILKGPPILDHATWDRLQTILDERGFKKSRTDKTSPLLYIARCYECDAPLYYHEVPARNGYPAYKYYLCPKKDITAVNGDVLHEMVTDFFLDELGDHERVEKIVRKPTDHSNRIAELKAAIGELASLLGSLESVAATERLMAQMKSFDTELARLEAEHSTDETVELRPTGETYRELWERSDTDGRRQLMLQAGIQVRAKPLEKGNRTKRGTVFCDFAKPDDLLEKLA